MHRQKLTGIGDADFRYFKITLLIYASWVILILYLAFQPFEAQDLQPLLESIISEEDLRKLLPRVEFTYAGAWLSYREPYILLQFVIRKAAHLFFYAGLAFLVAYQQLLVQETAVKAFSRALMIVILMASADEGIQYLHEDRSGLVEDVVLNIFGSVFVLLWLAWRERGDLTFRGSV